ncbi:MAG TPA: hypothetical protein VJR06_00620 [Nitrososphaerales archaeon]|nr:hypothetical protein [Nitrososphaerales archaeon]
MSVKKTTMQYAAVAIIVSLGIIAASFLYIGVPMSTGTSNTSGSQGGQLAPLAIRLTDPPQVPSLTTSLNLTYSSLVLLVGEPTGTQGQLDTKSVTASPPGGSATIDLLQLQNVSQTIAVANLPNGSVLYSVTFTVTGISIDVNNTVSTVALATGGTSFEVTIAHPSEFSSGDFALLQLNPVVVDTPSGYQLIPSSVGVMGHGEGSDEIGQQHQLTNSENDALGSAKGNVSASILTLSVSGNVTTLTVMVNNSASIPVGLTGIGLHGNFTVIGSACASFGGQSPYQAPGEGDSHSNHTFNSDQNSSSGHTFSSDQCAIPMHMDEVVFVPVSSSLTTTTSTSTTASSTCATGQMALVNGFGEMSGFHQMTINPGQCVQLTFVGKLSFGNANFTLVPSTASGQVYILHVIASNGANQQMGCTLPLGAASCTVQNQQQDSQDW